MTAERGSMKRQWMKAALLTSGVVLGAACSTSPTGPAPGPIGNWHVTVSKIIAGGGGDTLSIKPSLFVLSITSTSVATFPTLYGIATNGDTIYTYNPATAAVSTFAISGDSIKISVDPSGGVCGLRVVGTIQSTSASGSAALVGMCGPTTSGSWSATKF
jgi:hypothetical protein